MDPSARAARRAVRRERLLLLTMLAFCGILLALQYRWTGALSRAGLMSLQSGLLAKTRAAADSFNGELRRLCVSLVPTTSELDARGSESAHTSRLADWLATETRRPFRRIAVVVPEGMDLALRELDQRDGKLHALEWPDSWKTLSAQMRGRWRGETGPPSVAAGSWLVELPMFDRDQHERGWMIFEIDDAYVRDTWLPELLTDTFAPDSGSLPVRVEVRARDPEQSAVLAWPASSARPARVPDAIAEVFPRALAGRPGRQSNGRWVMEVWYWPKPLEATVAMIRFRDFAVAALLVALIAATALGRNRVAASARRLAARELAFVAGVSHELRTPLAAIRGAGHNLRANVVTDPEKQRAYGALIVERADQLIAMVEQLISLASLRRSTHPSTPTRVAIDALVEEAVKNMAELAASSGMVVEVDLADGLPAVLGDGPALRRVFENLLGNAFTHGASGRWVGVRARATERSGARSVEVTVTDRGPGVPENDQARIWEPFVQGASDAGQTRKGFGLGLSLVREIVERHGGQVSLESRKSAGATFVVQLPAESPGP